MRPTILVKIGDTEYHLSVKQAKDILGQIRAHLKDVEGWAYDPEIAKGILARIADGMTLDEACEPPYPPPEVFLRWCQANVQLQRDYDEAVLRQADAIFTKIYTFTREIADRLQQIQSGESKPLSNHEVGMYRVLLETLRWMCAKLNPSKFADYQRVGVDTNIGWKITYQGYCAKCGSELLPKPALETLPPKPKERKRVTSPPSHTGLKSFIKRLGGQIPPDEEEGK